ncbi:Inner membrane protein ypdA [Sphingobacterium spiritivorum]|uniref:Inner membrane protein ypdA n=2 Tax=Sphingobacterium spiritivorum TaxID=258 RepID=A0A380BPR4_SPHSI|nr:Inner membrane protein ypdA [Sphingobacterium spiritivorum]
MLMKTYLNIFQSFQNWIYPVIASCFTVIILLLSMPVEAQKLSSVEKTASEGYALRFTDSVSSLNIQMKALELAKKNNNKEDEAICYAYLALTHRRLLHLREFAHYAELSYDVAATTSDKRAKAYAAMAMASLRSYIDDKSNAIDYFLQAYDLFIKVQDYDMSARIGADISYLFSSGSQIKVKKYADEALRYAIKSGNPESILHARLAVGSYLSDAIVSGNLPQWSEVVSFFNETILLAEKDEEKIVSKSNIGIAYINLAVLYMNGPQPVDEEAFLSNLEKATSIAKQYDLKNIYRSSIGLKGQYFMQKGEYQYAENLFKEGIDYQLTLPYKDNDVLATFYSCLKDVSILQNNYKAYYEYDKLFARYNRLKHDHTTQQMLQNADARYESEKKISRIQQLEQENRLQEKNKLLGYAIAAVLLIGLIFMYRSYYYRQRYYQNREDNLQQQQANNELKVQLMEKETLENLAEKLSLERRLLRSQMDPHFIFNALGNIQSMILQHDPTMAVSYLGKFAKLTRQVLEQSRMETITLEDEIQTLRNYMELQQLRLNNSFDYEIHCNDDLDTDILLPPLLIQPFIENAVEHGLKPLLDRRGLLTLSFSVNEEDNILVCTITDNGIGLKESRKRRPKDAHRSLSSQITDERLRHMLKDNPHTEFRVEESDETDSSRGCVVILHIPIN